MVGLFTGDGFEFPPRRWRLSYQRSKAGWIGRVCPMRVEVILPTLMPSIRHGRLLHAGGGDPGLIPVPRTISCFAPRAWRSSVDS